MRVFNAFSKILILVFATELLIACNSFKENTPNTLNPGVVYVVPRGNPRAESIVWSPKDSSKILVNASDILKGNAEVYILDILTKKKTLLVDTNNGVTGYTWSTDGKQIILSAENATKRLPQSDLWLMNTKDNSLEILSTIAGVTDWLPDGNTLALLTKDFDPLRVSVYLIDIRTKESNLIYSNQDAIAYSGFSSSPDGNYLVFSLDFGNSSSITNLYILNVQTGIVKQLTDDGASSDSEWSPIGDLIAYVKSKKVSDKIIYSLHILAPEGSCDVEIPNVDYALSPTWSPDGRKIAFIGEDGIYTIDTETVFGRDIYQKLCE